MELEKLNNPHHPASIKILALYMVFVTFRNYLIMGLSLSHFFAMIEIPITKALHKQQGSFFLLTCIYIFQTLIRFNMFMRHTNNDDNK